MGVGDFYLSRYTHREVGDVDAHAHAFGAELEEERSVAVCVLHRHLLKEGGGTSKFVDPQCVLHSCRKEGMCEQLHAVRPRGAGLEKERPVALCVLRQSVAVHRHFLQGEKLVYE